MAEDRLNLPFTGLVSFMRVPTCTDLDAVDADIATLGAPSDEGSPWKPGSRFAPRKIRELSIKYAGYGPVQHQLGYYDIDENRRFLEYERRHSRIVDCGDCDIVYTNVRRTFDNITHDERRQTLFAIARAREVIGFDLVEVNPMLDVPADNTSQLAAQLIIEFLGRIVEHPGYRKRHPMRTGTPARRRRRPAGRR